MAYTTINKSTDLFNTVTYTGTGSSNSVTGVGFQPDWVWGKQRSGTNSHELYDAVRGVNKIIYSDLTDAEGTNSNGVSAFNADGFTVAGNTSINLSGQSIVAWNWKAGGAGSANTDGSINSTVSVNTTAGFSIVSYTGTGANATVGHGLGTAPKFIVTKCTSNTSDWMVYYGDATDFLKLNTTAATEDLSTVWNDTSPTNTVFSLGNNGDVNTNGRTMVAYCFAEKTGYSKIGSYVGNGNANGPFVYTGFRPSFVMYKKSSASGNDWIMADNKRSSSGSNVTNKELYANSNAAEGSTDLLDLVSNGFKLRRSHTSANADGATYIYLAFGQSLVGTNNIPCNAR